MKALFLSHQAEYVYGGEVCTLAFMGELKRLGDTPHFASPPGPYADRARAEAVVHALPSVQFRRSLASLPRFAVAWWRTRAALARLVDREGIGLIHATSLKAMVYAWPLRKRVPVIWHHHDILPRGFANSRWLRALAAGAAKILVPSPATREALLEAGIAPAQVQVIANGFDPADWAVRGPKRGQSLRLGFVGELSHRKGADRLPQIFASAQAEGEVSLTIVGEALSDPAAGRSLREALAGQPGVEFLGRREDVRELTRGFDVLLVPSRQDPLPTVIIEAGLSGVPVVAAPAGGIPGMIDHGRNGFLVASDEEWGARLRELRDPGRWAELARGAREVAVERYDIRARTQELRDVYRGVMDRSMRG